MKVALTGTPGTGKSSVSRMVGEGFRVIDVNELVRERYNVGADPERGSLIADIDGLRDSVEKLEGNVILEGHLTHLLPADKIIVLRASPGTLQARLKARGWSDHKIRENLEAEALDIILVEAMDMSDEVYEIDTTDMDVAHVAAAVREIIAGTDKYRPGSVDFSEEMFL